MAKYYIGLDVGGSNITGGLINEKNEIIGRSKINTEAQGGMEHVLSRIIQVIDDVIAESDVSKKDINGVCLAIPGAVDPAKGKVIEAVNLGWHNVQIIDLIEAKTGLKFTLDNDVNVGAWGEFKLGAAKDSKNMLAIFVGTGIGGGIIINGELFHGNFKTAGEIGHTVIDTYAPIGDRTLEELASRTSIVNRLTRMVNANHPSKLKAIAGEKWPHIRSKVIAAAVEAEDELTIEVLKQSARVIGQSAANYVTLLNADCIVIGGGLTEAVGKRWLKWIRKSFEKTVFPDLCRDCEVKISELGDDAGLLGAALLARERLD